MSIKRCTEAERILLLSAPVTVRQRRASVAVGRIVQQNFEPVNNIDEMVVIEKPPAVEQNDEHEEFLDANDFMEIGSGSDYSEDLTEDKDMDDEDMDEVEKSEIVAVTKSSSTVDDGDANAMETSERNEYHDSSNTVEAIFMLAPALESASAPPLVDDELAFYDEPMNDEKNQKAVYNLLPFSDTDSDPLAMDENNMNMENIQSEFGEFDKRQ